MSTSQSFSASFPPSLTIFGYNQYSQLCTPHAAAPIIPKPIQLTSNDGNASTAAMKVAHKTDSGHLVKEGMTNENEQTLPYLPPQSLLNLSCGRFHTLLLDHYGRVQSYGLNREFQRGCSDGEAPNGSLVRVWRSKHTTTAATQDAVQSQYDQPFISKIACGGSHSILIDENGIVYAFGDNTEGQCGVGEDLMSVQLPREVRLTEESDEVAAQNAITNASTTIKDEEDLPQTLHPITQAFCGDYTSFFLEKDRRTLWVCGMNESGQCGQGDNVENVHVPVTVTNLFHDIEEEESSNPQKEDSATPCTITKVACGEMHTLILRSDGRVLVSGSNDDGALGNPSSTRFTVLSFFVQRSLRVVDVACGSRHSLFLTEQGAVWVCGKNNYNQLGFHGKQNLEIPVRLTDGVRAVYAGSDFSLLLGISKNATLPSTTLMTAGRNKDGELGIPSSKGESSCILRSFTIPGEARLIACGGYHTIILTGPPLPTHPLYISYARHRRIVNRLKSQQSIHIQEMQTEIHLKMEEFNQKQVELQQQYEEKIQQQELESKRIMDELHQKHHDEKFTLKASYDEKIQQVEIEIHQTVNKMEEEIKANKDQTEAIKTRYESVISQKEASLSTLQTQLMSAEKEMSQKLQSSIQEENKRHQVHLEKLQKQYEHMISLLEARLSSQDRQSLSDNYRDKYQEELKEKKRLLDEEYQRQLRKMQAKLDDEYRKNILWLITLKKQYELSQRELKTAHVRKIKQQEEQISQLLDGLNTEKDRQIEVEDERFERLRKQHETELNTLRTKHHLQLEKQKQLNNKLLKGKNIEPAVILQDTGESLMEAQTKIRELEQQLRQAQQQQIAKQFHSLAGSTTTPVKRMAGDSPTTPSSPRVLPRVSLSDLHISELVHPSNYTKGEFIGRLSENNMFSGNMEVAIKEMHISSRDKEHMGRHVYRLMQLQHPYVLKCYGVHFVDDDALVLCEHCTQSIMEYISEQDLGLSERITLSMQILEACMYLVECRMHVHLKLENVLVSPDGSVRLDVIGSTYLAPERHALIYAFGMMLYQLTTLRTMITTDSETDELSLPESCPQNLKSLILSLTHADHSMRPTQMESIMDQLLQVRNSIFSAPYVTLDLHVESFDKRHQKLPSIRSNSIANLKFQILRAMNIKQAGDSVIQLQYHDAKRKGFTNIEDLSDLREQQKTPKDVVKIRIVKVPL